jgi:hypothetical protein
VNWIANQPSQNQENVPPFFGQELAKKTKKSKWMQWKMGQYLRGGQVGNGTYL